jgi:acetyl-CoA synthetase
MLHKQYHELDTTSNKVANVLIEMGIGKGDRVAILLPDTPESAAIRQQY